MDIEIYNKWISTFKINELNFIFSHGILIPWIKKVHTVIALKNCGQLKTFQLTTLYQYRSGYSLKITLELLIYLNFCSLHLPTLPSTPKKKLNSCPRLEWAFNMPYPESNSFRVYFNSFQNHMLFLSAMEDMTSCFQITSGIKDCH